MSAASITATVVLAADVAQALIDRLSRDPRYENVPVDGLRDGATTCVTLYFEERPARGAVQALNALVEGSGSTARFQVETLPATDWIATSLRTLTPVRAGRFLVHGQHDRTSIRPNDIAMEVEAGEAFGTGHHGTTVGCLRALDATLAARPVRRAADIGTGTGVLAIAIARRAHVPVLATDNDPVAVRVAGANVRSNGVRALVRCAVATGTSHPLFRAAAPFDLIVANILATPLATMAHDIARITAPGAVVILSGLLPRQRRRLVAAYRNAGLRLIGDETVEGWLTLRMQRPRQRR